MYFWIFLTKIPFIQRVVISEKRSVVFLESFFFGFPEIKRVVFLKASFGFPEIQRVVFLEVVKSDETQKQKTVYRSQNNFLELVVAASCYTCKLQHFYYIKQNKNTGYLQN